MSSAELNLSQWRSLDLATVRDIARRVAAQVGGTVTLVETVQHLGAPLHRVHVERQGQEFALIPGGRVRLGFDLDVWQPTPAQTADYARSLDQGFGRGRDLKAHLAQELSPNREATVATVLMAVENERLAEPPAALAAALAARGLRMPSADEWEHACGAGATTLFRWGDECPLDRTPYGDDEGPHAAPNAFGLRIAYDTYQAELSEDTDSIHGGDGGEAECGGYGALLAWLTLATANRNPAMAEFVYGPESEGAIEDFSIRPVIAL